MPRHKLSFRPHGISGYFEAGITLREAALDLGIVIESTCAGIGTCGECRVIAKKGVGSPTSTEQDLLTPAELARGTRLSCQAELSGACDCEVPPASRSPLDRIMVEGLATHTHLDPDTIKVHVRLSPPQLGQKYFDFEQLLQALQQRGHRIQNYSLQTVRELPQVLRESDFAVTAVIDQATLLAVEPGDTNGILFGAAIDVGTTTIAAKLIDLNRGDVIAFSTAANPQVDFGADVISRLKYVADHREGLQRLHRLVIACLDHMLFEMSEKAGIRLTDIYKVVVAGNTVMQHLLLEVDPRHLAVKPYAPASQGPHTVAASSLGFCLNAGAVVYAMPNLAGFVGSDLTGVLTVLELEASERWQAVIDMGTNGEIIVGSKDRILCSSSPAGPAWEGACITWGMRATAGAIERVQYESGTLQLRTIGGLAPTGLCGSGVIDTVGEFLRAGLLHRSGRILRSDEIPAAASPALQSYVNLDDRGRPQLCLATTAEGRELVLTQGDIREVQLAKAAIAAGLQLILRELRLPPEALASVYVAGAFGNHLRSQDVCDLGLVPQVAPDKIQFIGNAALSGAEAILRSRTARIKAEQLARNIEYLEVADRPEFQDYFVAALPFTAGKSD